MLESNFDHCLVSHNMCFHFWHVSSVVYNFLYISWLGYIWLFGWMITRGIKQENGDYGPSTK